MKAAQSTSRNIFSFEIVTICCLKFSRLQNYNFYFEYAKKIETFFA